MGNMNAISVLTLMPGRKEEIKSYTDKVIQELKSGYIDPLKLLSQLKSVEKTIKIITDNEDAREIFLNSLNGDKKREEHGCVFEESEAGVKYDYSMSQDWINADKKVKEAESNKKAIETRLKTASVNTPYVDISTGEEITAVAKSSKTIVKVTLK